MEDKLRIAGYCRISVDEELDRSGYTFEQSEDYQKLRKKMLLYEYDILIIKGLVELEDLRDAGMRIISIGDSSDFPTFDDWTTIQFPFLINEMPVTDTSKKVAQLLSVIRKMTNGYALFLTAIS